MGRKAICLLDARSAALTAASHIFVCTVIVCVFMCGHLGVYWEMCDCGVAALSLKHHSHCDEIVGKNDKKGKLLA